jgi:pimeloyl-ACP methyl ester carboxylesterase
MVVWGARDRVIPADHGIAAHAAMPGSRLELFERAGHFPHAEEPARFARVLLEFIEQTSPAEIDQEQVQGLLAAEGAPS